MELSEQISPALKSWIDNVIVPALVKAYVAESGKTELLRHPGLE